MHTSRKEVGMKILVNSNARLNFSKPRSFKLEEEGRRSRKELGRGSLLSCT